MGRDMRRHTRTRVLRVAARGMRGASDVTRTRFAPGREQRLRTRLLPDHTRRPCTLDVSRETHRAPARCVTAEGFHGVGARWPRNTVGMFHIHPCAPSDAPRAGIDAHVSRETGASRGRHYAPDTQRVEAKPARRRARSSQEHRMHFVTFHVKHHDGRGDQECRPWRPRAPRRIQTAH